MHIPAYSEHEESVDQDEIRAQCEHCHSEYTVAYWDEELESYIYLRDEE